MARIRGQWARACGHVLTLVAGGSAFVGCSLVTAFEFERDAGGERPDLEEHDAAAPPGQPGDTATDTDTAEARDAQAGVDASGEPPVETTPEAGPSEEPAALPEASAGPEGPADGGSDTGARPGVRDLIDAVDGARKDRTDRVCSCPGAAQECARAGFSKSSCLARGLEAFSGASEEGVRELLECLLPAEQAYTACVERRVNCREVQAAMSACALEYELATARCSTMSIQGLSLQSLCSR